MLIKNIKSNSYAYSTMFNLHRFLHRLKNCRNQLWNWQTVFCSVLVINYPLSSASLFAQDERRKFTTDVNEKFIRILSSLMADSRIVQRIRYVPRARSWYIQARLHLQIISINLVNNKSLIRKDRMVAAPNVVFLFTRSKRVIIGFIRWHNCIYISKNLFFYEPETRFLIGWLITIARDYCRVNDRE